MKKRFNAYDKTLYEFITDILVVCPKCEKQAFVKTKGFLSEKNENDVKFICPNCGMNKYYSETPTDKFQMEKSGKTYEMRNLIIGGNIDPYFRLPLWLQKRFSDGLLWAYNYEHLTFIENHVSAELRERNVVTNHNRSLGSRLPKWITSKKNREEILIGIKQMKTNPENNIKGVKISGNNNVGVL